MPNTEKIKIFTDLDAWKEGHRLVLAVYEMTKAFPKTELFGLVSQMRRCVVSITSNIAEGFSRKSYREKAQFYAISNGSLTELQNQLIIAKDIKYITQQKFETASEQAIKVKMILGGLIRKTKSYS
ncbi:MAG: S23 ribosomal protein [uncultured bacterium]|nr:MAG: S23 ribosomal protein [uncultured bacterium]OGJ46969.1 MAG: hypothetical protein A2244_04480 [Candidatus Peregrinibacteria bacterium RIFOXYA2_FULL_41_18]OGJ49387.1 MAG: hypothetical protein A2344_03095 [Candidatus Peregrinibacteria bacterium RIFOXYB12_FULL_41_12]OGJ53599.1 MAG: hypothetical protein A2448_02945 [Candidatus Peregrinibacteria bacterium RIFOXYC2_FULL_41_22]OGJ54062.1 MAG: hypothetical protein A2336_02135 [Candidatus Peregrinibacteria bacterium RIFOXYB2_FULL_41_88]